MSNNTQLVSQIQSPPHYVAQFLTSGIEAFSYYVQSDDEAFIVDPPFNAGIFRRLAESRHSEIKYIVLTHYAVDFIAGHTQLQGIPVIMGEYSSIGMKEQQEGQSGSVKFIIQQYKSGETFNVGKLKTIVIHTPGTTPEASCFLLQTSKSEDVCLFTGDTVLIEGVGRPQLSIREGVKMREYSSLLYDSIQRIKELMNPGLRIYPGHGMGSVVGQQIGEGLYTTLGYSMQHHEAFLMDRETFIQRIVGGVIMPPNYFYYDELKNQEGTSKLFSHVMENSKQSLGIDEFLQLFEENAYPIIDTRSDIAHSGFIKGSYWLPAKSGVSLQYNITTLLKHPDDPFLLIADEGQEAETFEKLITMGYVNGKGYADFDMNMWGRERVYLEVQTVEEIDPYKDHLFLDVRSNAEWKKEGVVKDALLISLDELEKEDSLSTIRAELSAKQQPNKVIVYSKTGGSRSKLASHILLNHDIPAIALSTEFGGLLAKGLQVINYEHNPNAVVSNQIQDNSLGSALPQEGELSALSKKTQGVGNSKIKILFEEGVKAFTTQQYIESLNRYSEYIEANPDDSAAFTNRGLCFLQIQDRISAENDFKRAIELDSYNPFPYFNMASFWFTHPDTLLNREHREECEIKGLNELYCSVSCLYLNLVYEFGGRGKELSQALEYSPNNVEALVFKSLRFLQNKQYEEAMQQLWKAQGFDPKNKTVSNLVEKLERKHNILRSTNIESQPPVSSRYRLLPSPENLDSNIQLQIEMTTRKWNELQQQSTQSQSNSLPEKTIALNDIQFYSSRIHIKSLTL